MMKQNLLLIILLLCSAGAFSQFEKGSGWASAGLGFNQGIQVYPALGLFVKDKVLLGVRVSSNGNRNQGTQSENVSLSVPVRRYLALPMNELWAWWEITPGGSYINRWANNANVNRTFQWRGSVGLNAGVSYAFRPRLLAEAGIGLLYASAGQDFVSNGGQNTTDWAYSWGLNVFNQSAQLAVTYVFGPKKP